MKIIKMIDWEKGDDKFPRCSDQDNLEEFWEYVKEFLKKKELKNMRPIASELGIWRSAN